MNYLRGSEASKIVEIAEEAIKSGIKSVTSPTLSPTLDLSRQTVGNLAESAKELGDNLFELRRSIMTG